MINPSVLALAGSVAGANGPEPARMRRAPKAAIGTSPEEFLMTWGTNDGAACLLGRTALSVGIYGEDGRECDGKVDV